MPRDKKNDKKELHKDTCSQCKFFEQDSGPAGGVCLVNPPVLVPDDAGDLEWHRGGPVTPDDGVCRFFQRKVH